MQKYYIKVNGVYSGYNNTKVLYTKGVMEIVKSNIIRFYKNNNLTINKLEICKN